VARVGGGGKSGLKKRTAAGRGTEEIASESMQQAKYGSLRAWSGKKERGLLAGGGQTLKNPRSRRVT